jgi:hypothetical protein
MFLKTCSQDLDEYFFRKPLVWGYGESTTKIGRKKAHQNWSLKTL